MKQKKIFSSFLIIIFFLIIPFFCNGAEEKVFNYKALETIPGITTKGEITTGFNEYIGNLYTFLVSIVGICALFMITVGGYMYLTSAGNSATLGQAKNIIKDAIIGLLIALLSYLIFYTINPALVSPSGLTPLPKIGSTKNNSGSLSGGYTGGVAPAPGSYPESGAYGKNLSQAEVDAQLTSDKFRVYSSGSCISATDPTCTSFEGFPQQGVDSLLKLQQMYGNKITITGGTETGHITHGPGQPIVDINGTDPNLRAILNDPKKREELGITQVCTPPQFKEYRLNCDNYNEPGNTYHVKFGNPSK